MALQGYCFDVRVAPVQRLSQQQLGGHTDAHRPTPQSLVTPSFMSATLNPALSVRRWRLGHRPVTHQGARLPAEPAWGGGGTHHLKLAPARHGVACHPSTRRLRQEIPHKFKASPGYLAGLCLKKKRKLGADWHLAPHLWGGASLAVLSPSFLA